MSKFRFLFSFGSLVVWSISECIAGDRVVLCFTGIVEREGIGLGCGVGVISGSVGFFLVDDWWGYKARSVEI